MHDYGWSNMGGMWIFWLLILALIVGTVWRASRHLSGRGPSERSESPQDILKKRYARGEIDKNEYEERLRELKS
jgi:putative membrane protein